MKSKKTLLAGVLALAIVLLGSQFVAEARSNSNRVPATNQRSGQVVVIPQNAVQVADHVFSLGTAIVDGKTVEGYMIIDYKEGFGHKPNHNPKGGGGDKKGGPSTCFDYFAKDAKWKTSETWLVNAANSSGLGDAYVLSNLSSDVQKWEDAATKDIFGNGSLTTNTLVADTVAPDNLNEVYFADIASPGAIAVTIVWGRFSGPPKNRELLEWDQVYDDVDYDWSSSGEAGKMDFENIATHELGHSFGMGHPEDSCTDETMYRLADFGEVKKRDLNTGDIEGVDKLYK